jgi:hypothetical protein
MKPATVFPWFVILASFPLLAWGQGFRGGQDDAIGPAPIKQPGQLKFKHKSFTLVRVQYSGSATRRNSSWATDYPDSDAKISARFAKMTGLETSPAPKVMKLTDPKLQEFPFLYLVEAGELSLSDAEARGLRQYLLGGGFLMVDDFWGKAEWDSFVGEFKKVFPDRELRELPIEHPIFHCFYDLNEKPQVPSIHAALSGRTTERLDALEAHYQGVFDDQGRLMAVICHNTDLGDGWERGDEDANYFREYSQKKAYPMGINILVYALTQ